jgi:TolB-like protein/DNA-binding winged helix-turn-helix (wHTH) protein
MGVEVQKAYLLRDFLLEPDNHLLKRQGLAVSLNRKRFQVLVYLIEHRDRLVPRQELLDRFWDGSDVYEENLTKCISDIRKILDDQKKPHEFIETVPGVSYRYVGPFAEESRPALLTTERTSGIRLVVEEDDERGAEVVSEKTLPAQRHAVDAQQLPQASLRRSSWLLPAIVVVAFIIIAGSVFVINRSRTPANSAAPIRSIAVLPLKNLTSDPNNEYFSDGVTESLISSLSKIGELRVISSSSVFRFKDQQIDPREVGKQLNVGAVLEGTVRKDQESILVEVRLVSTDDGQVLWVSDTNAKPLRDIFGLQDEIARNVIAGLRVKLNSEGTQRLGRRYTNNVEAYQLYLRGRYHWDKFTVPDVRRSIDYFQQAINVDPSYPLPYTGLADAYCILNGLGAASPEEVIPKAKFAVARALELDDTLPEAHTSAGVVKDLYDWDFAGAEREFKRAIELNPNSSTAHELYGKLLPDITGGFDEALVEVKHALDLDPFSVSISETLGELLFYSRQYDLAIAQWQKTLQLEPSYGLAKNWIARAYEAQGHYDQSIDTMLNSYAAWGMPETKVAELKGIYLKSGWTGFWKSQLAFFKRKSRPGYQEPYRMAWNCIRAGDKEQALEWLERAYKIRSAWMPSIRYDPLLDSLRSDARFESLVRRVAPLR